MATNIGNVFFGVQADTNSARKDISRFRRQIEADNLAITSRLSRAGTQLSVAFTVPIVAAANAAFQASVEVERLAKTAGAITSLAEFGNLNRLQENSLAFQEQAKEIAREIEFTSSQIAETQVVLARAGFTTNTLLAEQGELIKGIGDLATSANLEVQQAAEITAVSLGALGFTTETERLENLGRVSDILNVTAASATTTVQELSEAIKFAGPLAAQLGVPVEDLGASLGVLANSGFRASIAGTGLRAIFRGLVAPLGSNGELIEELGIQINDAEGNFRGLTPVLQQFQEAFKDLNDSEISGVAFQLFGQRGGPAFLNLVNEASTSLVDLQGRLLDAEGATEQLAEAIRDSASGNLARLRSAIESLGLAFFQDTGLLNATSNFAENITGVVNAISELNPQTLTFIASNLGLLAALGPAVRIVGFYKDNFASLINLFAVTGPRALFTFLGPLTILGSALGLAFKNSEDLRNTLGGVLDSIINIFNGETASGELGFFQQIKESFVDILPEINEIAGRIGDNIARYINELSQAFSGSDIGGTIDSLISRIPRLFEITESALAALIPSVITVAENLKNGISNIIDAIGEDGIALLFEGAVDAVTIFGASIIGLTTTFEALSPTLGVIIDGFKSLVEGLLNLAGLFGAILDPLISLVPLFNGVTEATGGLSEAFRTLASAYIALNVLGRTRFAQTIVGSWQRIGTSVNNATASVSKFQNNSQNVFVRLNQSAKTNFAAINSGSTTLGKTLGASIRSGASTATTAIGVLALNVRAALASFAPLLIVTGIIIAGQKIYSELTKGAREYQAALDSVEESLVDIRDAQALLDLSEEAGANELDFSSLQLDFSEQTAVALSDAFGAANLADIAAQSGGDLGQAFLDNFITDDVVLDGLDRTDFEALGAELGFDFNEAFNRNARLDETSAFAKTVQEFGDQFGFELNENGFLAGADAARFLELQIGETASEAEKFIAVLQGLEDATGLDNIPEILEKVTASTETQVSRLNAILTDEEFDNSGLRRALIDALGEETLEGAKSRIEDFRDSGVEAFAEIAEVVERLPDSIALEIEAVKNTTLFEQLDTLKGFIDGNISSVDILQEKLDLLFGTVTGDLDKALADRQEAAEIQAVAATLPAIDPGDIDLTPLFTGSGRLDLSGATDAQAEALGTLSESLNGYSTEISGLVEEYVNGTGDIGSLAQLDLAIIEEREAFIERLTPLLEKFPQEIQESLLGVISETGELGNTAGALELAVTVAKQDEDIAAVLESIEGDLSLLDLELIASTTLDESDREKLRNLLEIYNTLNGAETDVTFNVLTPGLAAAERANRLFNNPGQITKPGDGFAQGGIVNFGQYFAGEAGRELVLPDPRLKPVAYARALSEGAEGGFFPAGTPNRARQSTGALTYAPNYNYNVSGPSADAIIAKVNAREESNLARIGGILG